MQTLDVISINIWNMLVSLANLVILYLLVKKFLYNPVKNMLLTRQKNIDDMYQNAEEIQNNAMTEKKLYEEKLSNAKKEADSLLQSAVDTAHIREEEILAEAKNKADVIIEQARNNAELETKKAEEEIKTEIINVSTMLAEKMLDREISADDHQKMIDSFLDNI